MSRLSSQDITKKQSSKSKSSSLTNIRINTSSFPTNSLPTYTLVNQTVPTNPDSSNKKYNTGCFVKIMPFPMEYKEYVIRNVFDDSSHYKFFNELKPVLSNDLGFQLPITNEWRTKLVNNDYIKNHNSRQIEFVDSNYNTIGLRCKDNISYWNIDELYKIKHLVDAASALYRIKNKSVTKKKMSPYDSFNKDPYNEQVEIDVVETKFFLEKLLKSIKNDGDYSKLKKFTTKLNGINGYKIVRNILKMYIKINKITWYNIHDYPYLVHSFIRETLLGKNKLIK